MKINIFVVSIFIFLGSFALKGMESKEEMTLTVLYGNESCAVSYQEDWNGNDLIKEVVKCLNKKQKVNIDENAIVTLYYGPHKILPALVLPNLMEEGIIHVGIDFPLEDKIRKIKNKRQKSDELLAHLGSALKDSLKKQSGVDLEEGKQEMESEKTTEFMYEKHLYPVTYKAAWTGKDLIQKIKNILIEKNHAIDTTKIVQLLIRVAQ